MSESLSHSCKEQKEKEKRAKRKYFVLRESVGKIRNETGEKMNQA